MTFDLGGHLSLNPVNRSRSQSNFFSCFSAGKYDGYNIVILADAFPFVPREPDETLEGILDTIKQACDLSIYSTVSSCCRFAVSTECSKKETLLLQISLPFRKKVV